MVAETLTQRTSPAPWVGGPARTRLDEIAAGFVAVANASMAEAISQVTTARGVDPRGCDLLMLDQALSELSDLDERQGTIVELCYFGGLTEDEVAATMSVSRSTVARELRSAKAWLHRRMTSGRPQEST